MLDWRTVHRYAEEIELWTSLAINCWVLITATMFAIVRLRTVKVDLGDFLYSSITIGAVVGIIFAGLGSMYFSTFTFHRPI